MDNWLKSRNDAIRNGRYETADQSWRLSKEGRGYYAEIRYTARDKRFNLRRLENFENDEWWNSLAGGIDFSKKQEAEIRKYWR